MVEQSSVPDLKVAMRGWGIVDFFTHRFSVSDLSNVKGSFYFELKKAARIDVL